MSEKNVLVPKKLMKKLLEATDPSASQKTIAVPEKFLKELLENIDPFNDADGDNGSSVFCKLSDNKRFDRFMKNTGFMDKRNWVRRDQLFNQTRRNQKAAVKRLFDKCFNKVVHVLIIRYDLSSEDPGHRVYRAFRIAGRAPERSEIRLRALKGKQVMDICPIGTKKGSGATLIFVENLDTHDLQFSTKYAGFISKEAFQKEQQTSFRSFGTGFATAKTSDSTTDTLEIGL